MAMRALLPSRPEDYVKFGALVVLVVQTTSLAMVARYSRVQTGPLYLVSTAVVMSEVLKFSISFVLVMIERGGVKAGLQHVHAEILGKPEDSLKMMVPALLFTLQNNLGYFALQNLDVATYQILYQLKILTTAVFSVVMLKRVLHWMQWTSLFVLVGGVALVQLSGLKASSAGRSNSIMGLAAVLLSCCSSGLAGVYFEKVLKGSELSVWMRNMELAIFSMIIGLMGVYSVDLESVKANGFFHGYNGIVWTAISLQAGGGITVAVVIKYADNVLKGFATSISIVLSCLISIYVLGDFTLSPMFFVGAVLVMAATVLYGTPLAVVNRALDTYYWPARSPIVLVGSWKKLGSGDGESAAELIERPE